MELYQSVGFLLFGTRLKRLSEVFLADVNRVYRKNRIRFEAGWFPVFYLLSQQEEVSIRQIADALHVSHSAASQMVSNLQEKGLVKSTVSRRDARHKVVTFTSKGARLLDQVLPVWQALEAAMQQLAHETAEGRHLLPALTVIENSLRETPVFNRVEARYHS
ncbi:MAG TPA: MarR family transcriptional regulator [Lacibacter sp.]|nr:MarR family transcriptional regulator [Lacibacter sp.]HMO90325.1 MarR family transcriptional regulator [Lacibacter sp.]HMP88271.1 MarR family transcriptional regulator [Lacibacter sp.]